MNNEKKIRVPLWIYPSVQEKVESNYKKDNCKSQSAFIEKAILFYCGYLTAENYREYFPSIIVSTIKGSLDLFEDRIASLLFKLAVELSMSLHVTAATNEINGEALSKLRAMCVSEVKKIHGSISFDEAFDFQKG